MTSASASRSTLSDEARADLQVIDVIGQLMRFWGFKRPMGRIWALLYLSSEPVSASEIAERLEMSAGAVSMTLAELVHWQAVKRHRKANDRRDFFEAETSIWSMVRHVVRNRELELVRQFQSTLAAAESALPSGATRSNERLAFKRQRLETLRSLCNVGERLLFALVEGKAVDPTPIAKASSQS
jgi:HTH-type transcriptional regulator, glycine betaine synthesis regulator